MHKLHEAALADTTYQQLVPASKHTLSPDLRAFWNGREHLSVDNGLVMRGERLVVPRSLHHSVLQDLHAAHEGLTRTKRRARQTVFWPHLTNDLDNLIRSCPQCRLHAASQPKEPLLVEDRTPTRRVTVGQRRPESTFAATTTKKCQRWGCKPFRSLPFPSLLSPLSLSLSLSLFLFPSLSEEAIQVVDLPQAGVGPHTQDTPFKLNKKLFELLGAKRACLPEEERTPKHPRQSFHFWS